MHSADKSDKFFNFSQKVGFDMSFNEISHLKCQNPVFLKNKYLYHFLGNSDDYKLMIFFSRKIDISCKLSQTLLSVKTFMTKCYLLNFFQEY